MRLSKLTRTQLAEARKRWRRRLTIADNKLYAIEGEICRRMLDGSDGARPPVKEKKAKAGPEKERGKITRRFASES